MTSPKPTITFVLDIPSKEIRARRPRISGGIKVVGLLKGMGLIEQGEDVEVVFETIPFRRHPGSDVPGEDVGTSVLARIGVDWRVVWYSELDGCWMKGTEKLWRAPDEWFELPKESP